MGITEAIDLMKIRLFCTIKHNSAGEKLKLISLCVEKELKSVEITLMMSLGLSQFGLRDCDRKPVLGLKIFVICLI